MSTATFIEQAIEGGWQPRAELMPRFFQWRKPIKVFVAGSICSIYFETSVPNAERENILVHVSDIILDPYSWQAVGKIRGWDYVYTDDEDQVITADKGEEMLHVPGYSRWIGWKYHAYDCFLSLMAGMTPEKHFENI